LVSANFPAPFSVAFSHALGVHQTKWTPKHGRI
jgi:hypothetical protein